MINRADVKDFKEITAGVWLKTLTHGEKTHLTEVRFDKGALVPEHRHPHEQTGYLISGSLRFFSGSSERVVLPGDSWIFPGDTPHGAEALEDTVIVEVFSPLREDILRG